MYAFPRRAWERVERVLIDLNRAPLPGPNYESLNLLVPMLRVGTLGYTSTPEGRRMHSHAERGNESINAS